MNAIVPADSKSEGRARGRRWWRRAAIGLVATIALVAALFALFALNGTSDTWRKPEIGRSSGAIVTEPVSEVRVMALNVAKCWFHRGGLDFADRSELLETLDRIAETVRSESPDLLFLSEVVIESAPVALNQVEYLSRACGFAHHVSSENYSFGLPFCRIRSGNALLARFDTRALETVQLEGEFRFWNPTNNRRALFCEVQINETWLLVGSIRNDSFDLVNNLRQVEQILAYVGTRPALLAGDFNAEPTTAPIRRLAETGAFTDPVAAPATFPASAPTRRIDQILAPRAWVMREQHVVDTRVSDHLAVVATFGLR